MTICRQKAQANRGVMLWLRLWGRKAAGVALVLGASCTPQLWADEAADSEGRLRTWVGHLASDELEGRGVGTAGLDKAADYLAEQFQSMGLKTDVVDGKPFQPFEISLNTELGERENNTLVLFKEGTAERVPVELEKGFSPLAIGGSGKFAAPLVFVGYGISAKEYSYDDYEGVGVKGMIVVILRKEPQQKDEKSVFNGTKPSGHAPFQRKIQNAKEHGAVGVLFVNDSLELKQRSEMLAKQWEQTLDIFEKSKQTNATGNDKVKQIADAAADVVEAGKELLGDTDKLPGLTGAGDDSGSAGIPVLFCARKTIEPLVQQSLGKSLQTIENEIDGDLKPRSGALGSWRGEGEVKLLQKKAQVKNVLAELPAEGALAQETIVVGAHYDHLGMGGMGSLAPWTTEIHNGADDNASGTATLLEVAKRLTSRGKKMQRRIVFIGFTGEERGLLGSAHYVRNPRFALESTIAMFNLDMVGRLADDKLIVYGTGTAKEFDPLVDALGGKLGLKLTKHAGGFGPSDHSSFYAKQIPVLHLFTGTHTDYHRPSDDSDKLNIVGMRKIADYLMECIDATDAAAKRPEYVEIKQVETIGGGDNDRPYLGTIPDFASNGEGLALTGVSPSGPAAKAGIMGGDVIIQIGPTKIRGIEDLEGALRQNKPGDKVKIVVMRAGKMMEFEALLTARPK